MSLRLLVEIAPPLLAALLAWLFRGVAPGLWALPSRLLRPLARTRRRAILSAALLTLAICPIYSWLRLPRPYIHDEFSYLLAADTFAHGRLTNPAHPLSRHFESFHVLQRPTYQSKYPPGQGLFLAVGQVLTGQPIVGVWLGMAAAAAAVCWMLLAWMPPRWALFGGLLPILRFGTLLQWDGNYFAYWSTTFWGGGVAMAGGALLFGALPRLLRKPRARDAALMGAGLVVLANTRPYEGFVAAIPVAVLLAGWMVVRRRDWRTLASAMVLPMLGSLGLGAVATGYYNYRVTGDPLIIPYVSYRGSYSVAHMFPLRSRHSDLTFRTQYFDYLREAYERRKADYSTLKQELGDSVEFYWGGALVLPLLWLLSGPWSPWAPFGLAMIAAEIAANKATVVPTLYLHYLAPIAPWFIFLPVAGLRRARVFRLRGRRVGRPLAEAIVAVCLVSFAAASVRRGMVFPRYVSPLGQYRPLVTQQLEATGGKHLVIVTYNPDHNVHQEWVYNGADLDGAPIVWARDLGDKPNRDLLDYYTGRRIWRLYADKTPPLLEPYSVSPEPDTQPEEADSGVSDP